MAEERRLRRRGQRIMTSQIAPELAARKRAEHLVVGELLKREVLPYPLTPGASHVFKARTPTGRTIEMRVEFSTDNGKGDERRFLVPDFDPCPELFYLCVEFTNTAENVAPDHSAGRGAADGIRLSDEIGCVWVLPSTVFFVYSELDEESGLRELNLDVKQERYFGKPFREYNSFFRNRWEPITKFDFYRRFMKPLGDPGFAEGWEDFEDEMLALEVFENPDPDEEYLDWDDYVRSRSESLSG